METQLLQKTEAFTLKGSLFTFTILQLQTNNIDHLISQLEIKAKQTPNFFRNSPIVLDLQKLSSDMCDLDFSQLTKRLRDHNIFPVAVSNANSEQQQAATQAGLALIAQPTVQKSGKTSNNANASTHSKLITQPVRSGQQIYAKNSDLIVTASVSPGAELLADGNIHIYGTLRGRALAGINGNESARIFCHKIDAELVSVAGYYKLNEDIDTNKNQQNIQIYLKDQQLCIDTM